VKLQLRIKFNKNSNRDNKVSIHKLKLTEPKKKRRSKEDKLVENKMLLSEAVQPEKKSRSVTKLLLHHKRNFLVMKRSSLKILNTFQHATQI